MKDFSVAFYVAWKIISFVYCRPRVAMTKLCLSKRPPAVLKSIFHEAAV